MASATKKKVLPKKEFWAIRIYLVNDLFNSCIERMGLKNDAALSRLLGIGTPVISNMRNGRLHPGATLVLRIHRKIGMSVESIYKMPDLPTEYNF